MIIPTPTSILEDTEVDVFEEAISETDWPNTYEKVRNTLWSMYRYRMIGSCDVDRWTQILADRAHLLSSRYVHLLNAYDSADMTVLQDGSYVMTTTGKAEDMPQITASSTEYLSRRNETVQSYVPSPMAPYEAVDEFIDNLKDPYILLAYEFNSLFLIQGESC